ncbi:hypothetical protein [Arsenicicoccus dermatophilus]|uniref:hypothetical protein n=1 Tax=Arsenicicoccus dermatophilus TaxID=1076331 RepID=UPI003917575A
MRRCPASRCPDPTSSPAGAPYGAGLGLPTTGWTSAALSGSPALPPVQRNVVEGCLAMAPTWSIGHLFGVTAA